jgi:hypothetical protein
MKRLVSIGLVVVLVGALAACGGDSGTDDSGVSEDDARIAYMLGVGTVFAASLAAAFGQTMPGVTLVDDENLSIDNFDLTQMAADESMFEFPYTTVSGTATNTGETMEATLTFEGGPVETLSFTMSGDQLQSETGYTAEIVVNGQEMALQITPEDLRGE